MFCSLPWRLAGDLTQSRKSCVFAKTGLVFLNPFGFSPKILTVHCLLSHKPFVFHTKTTIFIISSPSIFTKKVWVFSFSLSMSYSLSWFLGFMSYYWDLRFVVAWIWVSNLLVKLVCDLLWICNGILYLVWTLCYLWHIHTHCHDWGSYLKFLGFSTSTMFWD